MKFALVLTGMLFAFSQAAFAAQPQMKVQLETYFSEGLCKAVGASYECLMEQQSQKPAVDLILEKDEDGDYVGTYSMKKTHKNGSVSTVELTVYSEPTSSIYYADIIFKNTGELVNTEISMSSNFMDSGFNFLSFPVYRNENGSVVKMNFDFRVNK